MFSGKRKAVSDPLFIKNSRFRTEGTEAQNHEPPQNAIIINHDEQKQESLLETKSSELSQSQNILINNDGRLTDAQDPRVLLEIELGIIPTYPMRDVKSENTSSSDSENHSEDQEEPTVPKSNDIVHFSYSYFLSNEQDTESNDEDNPKPRKLSAAHLFLNYILDQTKKLQLPENKNKENGLIIQSYSCVIDFANLHFEENDDKIIKALACFIQNSRVTTVCFRRSNLFNFSHPSYLFFKYVLATHPDITTLKILHSRHQKNIATIQDLAKYMPLSTNDTALTSLDLSGSRLEDIDAQYLSAILLTNKAITRLSLRKNYTITLAGLNNLVMPLAKEINTTLTSLNLNDNQFGNEGAAMLANMLFSNSTLTELFFARNGMTVEGLPTLLEPFKVNSTGRINNTLITLDISGKNEIPYQQAIPLLAQVMVPNVRNRLSKIIGTGYSSAQNLESKFEVAIIPDSLIPKARVRKRHRDMITVSDTSRTPISEHITEAPRFMSQFFPSLLIQIEKNKEYCKRIEHNTKKIAVLIAFYRANLENIFRDSIYALIPFITNLAEETFEEDALPNHHPMLRRG